MLSTIKNTQITAAFREVSKTSQEEVQLKGRGHSPRVTLKPRVSLCAARGGAPFATVCVGKRGGPRRVFPLHLVEEAASLLGVPSEELISSVR